MREREREREREKETRFLFGFSSLKKTYSDSGDSHSGADVVSQEFGECGFYKKREK